MSVKLVYVPISEFGAIITGKTPKTEISEYWDGVVPFITPTDIPSFDTKYLLSTERTLSETGVASQKKTLLPINSLCVSCIATIGKLCLTRVPSITNQQINSIIINDDYNPNYLLNVFRYYLPYLQLIGGGTGSGTPIINKNKFSKLKYPVFKNKDIQNKIALVLDNYDRLIENNNKRIRLLENMAESLYKEWFVRFRFPGHESTEFENEIPKGWEKARLRDIAFEAGKGRKKGDRENYNYYLPIDCIPNRNMALSEIDSIENAESSLESFKKGNILFGAMRSYFHKVIIAPFDGLTRSTCFILSSKEKEYLSYLYLLLYQDSTIDFSSVVSVGSTMPYVRWKDLNRLNVLVPSKEIIKKFNKIINPILQNITESYFVNQNLIKQRDSLLPRLMSGKLSVEGKEIV